MAVRILGSRKTASEGQPQKTEVACRVKRKLDFLSVKLSTLDNRSRVRCGPRRGPSGPPGASPLLTRELRIYKPEPLQTRLLARKHSSTEPQELRVVYVLTYALSH